MIPLMTEQSGTLKNTVNQTDPEYYSTIYSWLTEFNQSYLLQLSININTVVKQRM